MTFNDLDFCQEMSRLSDAIFHLCQQKERYLLRRSGVTSVELRTLQALTQSDLTMRELAERLGLSPSRMTRVVDNLAQKGMVERGESREDRRICTVAITTAGKSALEIGENTLHDFQKKVTASLSSEEKIQTLEALRRFVAAACQRVDE